MKKRKTKPTNPATAISTHNTERFLASVVLVERAMRKLDCAIAESKHYASMIVPQKGARK